MIKKILMLLFSILFITGCTATYNLEIDENGEITENVDLKESLDVIYSFTNNPLNYAKLQIESYSSNSKYKKYSFKYDFDTSNLIGTASRKYKNFLKYKTSSKIINEIFSSVDYVEKLNSYGIKYYVKEDLDIFDKKELYDSIIDEVEFNIIVKNKVINGNYDYNNGNVYTWVINKDNIKNIEINVSKERTLSSFIHPLIWFYLIIFCIILLIILYIWIKNKINNK